MLEWLQKVVRYVLVCACALTSQSHHLRPQTHRADAESISPIQYPISPNSAPIPSNYDASLTASEYRPWIDFRTFSDVQIHQLN
jgi:hypothetical protein